MPLKKKPSVLKRQRQEVKIKASNRNLKSKIKTISKKVRESVLDNKDDYRKKLGQALREIDKAVSKGVIHRNTAARKKGRMMKMVNKLTAGTDKSDK